ncbi:MAG: type I restriction endonuclease [Polyangiaceae bacterium]
MSLEEKLRVLADRIPDTVGHLQTEEATKNALVMPFIAALGYDVFNPLEVVPEFTADVGTKKGEKVDYAIKHGEEIIMLFEAKKASADLSLVHASQLYRYFSVTNARIAVLTNGVNYQFYSDLDAPNRMDDKPFLVIDMLNLKEDLIVQLGKITKEAFDLDGMLEAAGDLKYMREIRRLLDKQFEEPDDEFVRFFFSQACPNRNFVQSARDQFARLVSETLKQVITDRVKARFRSALEREGGDPQPTPSPSVVTEGVDGDESANGGSSDNGIETTDEELEGYRIVKAIVCNVVPPARVAFRDTKSYFGVLLDDNNRKPICRLHFNRTKKYVGLFDADKNETRHVLEDVDGLYSFAEQLREAAQRYLEAPPSGAGEVSSA